MVNNSKTKETILGPLPLEWNVKKIEEICDILDSQRVPLNKEQRESMKGNIPYYGANGVVDYINQYLFDEPLILMAEDGGHFDEYQTRPIAYKIEGKSWVNNHAHVLRPKEGIDFNWVFYSLVHKNVLPFINGGTRAKLNQADLRVLPIAIPPLPEQRKIAAILSSVDEAIEKTEAIIEQTEKVKKGLMQQLLTKGIGHTKFKKTEIGEIPEEWEVRKLEEVTLPKEGIRRGPFGGALKKEIFVNEGYAVYEQQHVIYNNMEEFRYFIDEKKFLEMKPFEVLPGDILISCSGTVGKVALVPENAKKGVINQALLRLRLENKLLSNLYAWYLFSSDFMQSKMTDMSHGSTLKNIVGMTELRKINIPIPPLDEQMEIVSILTSVDQKYQNERQKLSQLQTIKKGLMQVLLTGKVRVKVDDEVMSQ